MDWRGGLNAYGFANGDPVNFSDPFGLTSNDAKLGLNIALFIYSMAASHPSVMRAVEAVGAVPEAIQNVAKSIQKFGEQESLLEYSSKDVAKEMGSGGTPKEPIWTGAKRAATPKAARAAGKAVVGGIAKKGLSLAEVFWPTTFGYDPKYEGNAKEKEEARRAASKVPTVTASP